MTEENKVLDEKELDEKQLDEVSGGAAAANSLPPDFGEHIEF